MPHYSNPNRHVRIVTRKIFTNFPCCADDRAFEAACEGWPNDSWRQIYVIQEYDDPEMEYLRQWLLANGAEENDEWVLLSIRWFKI